MEDLRVGRVTIPASELEIRFSRSGGPGGQNVNKRDTRVEIVFDLASSQTLSPEQRKRALRRLHSRLDSRGRLRVTSSAERTQTQNRTRALETLRRVLEDALQPPARPRVATKPSRAARERRLASKRARSDVKRARRRPETE